MTAPREKTLPFQKLPFNRRQVLRGTAALAAGALTPVWAQPGKAGNTSRSLLVAQVVDSSLSQLDVSRDFLIGSRAAWQDINFRGGLRGNLVQHVTLETDGTATSLRNALKRVKDDPACLVLSGSVGDKIACMVATQLKQDDLDIAHVAPWLQNSNVAIDEQTFPIFAGREQQIWHALKTLSVVGLKELGAVYASEQDYADYHEAVDRIGASMGLKLRSLRGTGDLNALGQQLTSATPAVLLFLGGTPELAQFTRGLEKQARQRFVLALSDVNLQVLLQLGGAKNIPIIATQPVPLVNSSLPVVRAYRETLTRLFDEPPVPLSLAGFIAARYTYQVLQTIDGALTRQNALAAFQRRSDVDVGGFRISYDNQRRSASYVTQSMTTADGRLVG